MKKTIITLSVIFAAALGAQGQTTIGIPNTGSSSLTDLTVDPATYTPPVAQPFTRARLYFEASGVPVGVSVTLSGITITGDGITSSLSFSDVTLNSATTFEWTGFQSLDSSVRPWTPPDSRVSFNVQISGGALVEFSTIGYGLQYANLSGTQVGTAPGFVNIVAVPEPSTYGAAAGLLALFLWSSRRHLFKLAGSHPDSSCAGANGAA